jgi:DtxR family Mn-dependent transcriptional regulator
LIREAQDDNPERLRRWQELGLKPGAIMRILRFQPLDDIFEIQVGKKTITLGSEGLNGLFGELVKKKD